MTGPFELVLDTKASTFNLATYGVGYVEFDGYLRVEGRLTETDPERLRIGMPMEVVAVRRGGRVSYAFAPVDEA